jgi:hypothetical protein
MSIVSITLRAQNRDSVEAAWDLLDATHLLNLEYLRVEIDMKGLYYDWQDTLEHLPLEGRKVADLHRFPRLKRLLLRCEDWLDEYPSTEQTESVLKMAPILDECNARGQLTVEHSVLRQSPAPNIDVDELLAMFDAEG